MQLTPKSNPMLIAFGLVCLLQATFIDAGSDHVRQLLGIFRKIEYDETRKSVYLQNAKYGVQVQLREPLVKKVLPYTENDKLSQPCLNQMVAKVHDLKETFYAGFSYGCASRYQYTVECLEAAKPKYFHALVELRSETERCLDIKLYSFLSK